MSEYLFLCMIMFVSIFFKSFQQMNVLYKKYWWVMPTSYILAACEAYVWIQIIEQGWGWVVFWVGTGAGLGCMSSMFLHKRLDQWLVKRFSK